MDNNQNQVSYDVISKNRAILMGIAIISILLFHFTEDRKIYEYGYEGIIHIFYYWIGSSSVDAFLFFSGFGLYYGFKKNISLKTFYKKRLTKILIPYFIIAIPSWYWKDMIIGKGNFFQYIKDLFFISFFENGSKWYWYILMIVICYLIFPYVYEIVETASDKVTEHMRMILVFCFFSVSAIILELYYTSFFNSIQIALLRFPPFFYGCFFGKASWEKRKISVAGIVIMILSGLFLQLKRCNSIIIVRYVVAFFNISMCILFAIFKEILKEKQIKFSFMVSAL